MVNQDIVKLAKKARRGDVRAFEELCARKSENILFNALGILGNQQDAEDAAQETILQMYRSIGQLKTPEAVEVWILQIVRSKCYRILARRKPQDVELDAEDELREIADESDFLPEQYAEDSALQKELLDIVLGLPQKRREAVFLFYYDDLSVKEIAKLTGTNINTVTSNLTRARTMIKEKLIRDSENRADADLLYKGAGATVLGGALKGAAPNAFPPETVAAFNGKWQAAIHGMRPLYSPAKHIAQMAVAGVSAGVVFLGLVTGVVHYGASADETATASYTTTVQGADVEGLILFTDGDCACGHLNPHGARLGEPEIPVVQADWTITNLASNAVVSAGTGTVVSGEIEGLESQAGNGRYQLTFHIKDADGNIYKAERIFEINL
jgi:RNA polymerase sigma-70 factor (ECF subfamily)